MQRIPCKPLLLVTIGFAVTILVANAQSAAAVGQKAASVARHSLAPGLIPTTTTVVSSQNPSQVGETVVFTATVTAQDGGLPTGTVDYTDNGNPISGCIGIPLNGQAQALCQISSLGRGGHIIVANYSGDQHYAPSAGQIDQIVDVYIVLHNFTGPDGANPVTGLTMDGSGNLYGVATSGGNTDGYCNPNGCGTVFKITHRGSNWVYSRLYTFTGAPSDGHGPRSRVVFGHDGSLYGTTTFGGSGGGSNCGPHEGCGTFFRIRPPVSFCRSVQCPWNETVLYNFASDPDGALPTGDLIFDQTGNGPGNAYVTTNAGGGHPSCFNLGCGTVEELSLSGGVWSGTVLHAFTENGPDGGSPDSGVVFDQAGNLYGTTHVGAIFNTTCIAGCGTVFQLMPGGSGWTENTIYSFQGQPDGGETQAGVIVDPSGNLFGVASQYGSNNGGTAFELMADGGNNWSFSLLYSFSGGSNPVSGMVRDPITGALYGTTVGGGANGKGTIFKLTSSGSGWTYTDLYDFTGDDKGANPNGALILDASGNLYGVTRYAGLGDCHDDYNGSGCGVVFELMPPQN